MREIEIMRLARVDPDLYRLSIEMEAMYRGGKHFKGDCFWTVKGRRKSTGELAEFTCTAPTIGDARRQFRENYDDTARPYRYTVTASPAVPGLGRSFAWKNVNVEESPENSTIPVILSN